MMRSPRPPILDQTSWRLVVAALSVVLVGAVVIVIGVMATPPAPKPTPTPAVAAAMAFQESSSITPTPRVIAVSGTTTPAVAQPTATTSPALTVTPLATVSNANAPGVAPVASATPTPWLLIEDDSTDAASPPIATTVSPTTPPTTIAAVIVPTATATALPVAVLPSPTPIFLSPTPTPSPTPAVVPLLTPTAALPLTPTVAPPPTATVAPPSATVLPTIGPSSTAHLDLTAADWSGGFYRGDAQFYGRPWVAIYGAYSAYPRATLSFTLPDTPDQAATVTITGLDDEWTDLNQIALDVNGRVIFTGPSPFPNWDGAGNGENAAWTSVAFSIPAGVLRAGSNDITLSNLTPADSFNSPPYVLVSGVSLDLPGADGASVLPAIVPADANAGGHGSDKDQAQKKEKDDKSRGNGKNKGHDKNKHGR